MNFCKDGLHESLLVHILHKVEGVATTHNNSLGCGDGCSGRVVVVYGVHSNTDFVEASLYFGLIFVIGECYACIGNKGNLFDAFEMLGDLGERIAEILLACIG